MSIKRLTLPLLFILLIILLLRIPSFFEPYWYGDEGIYLAIGQIMRRGAVLYRDIWDNKTPLLYAIYALNPTLLWAKISAAICVLGTVLVTYKLTTLLLHEKSQKARQMGALLASFVTGVFLSSPLLEGTIANAELYFTLPIILTAYLTYKNVILVSEERTHPESLSGKTLRDPGQARMTMMAAGIGLLMSIAFLLKVPAILDFMGLFLAYSLVKLTMKQSNNETIRSYFQSQLKFYLPIFLTFVSLLTTIVLYFYFHHALSDFLTASFSQNASYVAIDSGPLSKLSNPLFIKALLLIISLGLVSLLYLRSHFSNFKFQISNSFLFLSFWFGFSLYGALLSNRPYLHYLLEIVPPFVLLLVYCFCNARRFWPAFIPIVFIYYQLVQQFQNGFALEPISYYRNWFDYVSERKTWEDYVNYFDSRTLNSYNIASYVIRNTNPDAPIFVWGDASFIYVLSNRPPATKFIQAHHLTTIDPKNYDLIINRLQKYQPKYILISRPGHFAFPQLEELVKKNYRKVAIFTDMHVYQNSVPVTPPPWKPQYIN